MTDAIDSAALAAGCSRHRILLAARMAGIEPSAAAAAVWIAIADPTSDIDGSALRSNQRAARSHDLVAWAARRAAKLGDAVQGQGGVDPTLADHSLIRLCDVYCPPAPRPRAPNFGYAICARTARRWQAKRRRHIEAGQGCLVAGGGA